MKRGKGWSDKGRKRKGEGEGKRKRKGNLKKGVLFDEVCSLGVRVVSFYIIDICVCVCVCVCVCISERRGEKREKVRGMNAS